MKKLTLLMASLLALPLVFTLGCASNQSVTNSSSDRNHIPPHGAGENHITKVSESLVMSENAIGTYPKAKVSYEDFKKLTLEVEAHRAKHLVDLDTFLKMSKDPGVIILDARTPLSFCQYSRQGSC